MGYILVKPTQDLELQYTSYIEEWEKTGEKIIPYASRRNGLDYQSLLLQWEKDATDEAYSTGFVPSSILFMVDESQRIFGCIHIRHALNENLLKRGGHIGYGVRPSERKRGIAKTMLALALPIAKGFGIKKALLTCYKDNLASARTILANGGRLENEVVIDEFVTQRYWISL